MKRMKGLSKLDKASVSLLTGLNLGLAIVMAPFIAVVTHFELAVRWMHKRVA